MISTLHCFDGVEGISCFVLRDWVVGRDLYAMKERVNRKVSVLVPTRVLVEGPTESRIRLACMICVFIMGNNEASEGGDDGALGNGIVMSVSELVSVGDSVEEVLMTSEVTSELMFAGNSVEEEMLMTSEVALGSVFIRDLVKEILMTLEGTSVFLLGE